MYVTGLHYRYYSDERLRTEYRRLKSSSNWRIKGDLLKENSRLVLEAAFELRNLGEVRWHSKMN